MAGFVQLVWGSPKSVTAGLATTVTWDPTNMKSDTYGNFSLNLWLLRVDADSDATVFTYPAVIMVSNQNVFNNSFIWTPSDYDVDTGVAHSGNHQMAWEPYLNNTALDVSKTDHNFRTWGGFSLGFSVHQAVQSSSSSSSSSISSTATSLSSSTSSSTPSTATDAGTTTAGAINNVSSNTSTPPAKADSPGKYIGVGVGVTLGVIIVCFIAGFFIFRHLKKRRAEQDTFNRRDHQPITQFSPTSGPYGGSQYGASHAGYSSPPASQGAYRDLPPAPRAYGSPPNQGTYATTAGVLSPYSAGGTYRSPDSTYPTYNSQQPQLVGFQGQPHYNGGEIDGTTKSPAVVAELESGKPIPTVPPNYF